MTKKELFKPKFERKIDYNFYFTGNKITFLY